MTINPDGRQSEGVTPTGSGYSAEPEPSCTVSAVPVSIPNAAMTEAWTVRSCIDAAGNHTCWDVRLPSDGRGAGVVASVFCDKQAAELIAGAPRLAAALEVAAARFRFLAEMQRVADRPESKGNANILEHHAEDCLASIHGARA